jgi:hypothetical protein
MWSSSGPYVRKSVLINLAKKAGDLIFPEAFYETTTFTEADGCLARSEDEEQDLARSISLRLKEHKQSYAAEEEEDHDEGDDDETWILVSSFTNLT